MPSPLNYYFLFTFLIFVVKSDKCGPTNLLAIRMEIFSKASFFYFFITPHIVYLLFVYPGFYFLFTSNFRNILFYLCIVLKVLFVYLLKTTFYLQTGITCVLFYCQLRELFVYHLKTTFYVPPRITCCLFLLTT